MSLPVAHRPQLDTDSGKAHRRRSSQLGNMIQQAKLERAQRLSPEERLLLALELADLCLEFRRACFAKPWQISSVDWNRPSNRTC